MDTNELLKKVRKLEIKAKGLTKQIFSGEYHSAFKGRGMTFSEVRNYQFGDEVRTIDWNVTARFNEPFVKVFEEEREMTVMLLIDVSGSHEFGSNSKSKKDLALELAAILAFSAVANNDKVGAIFFSNQIEKYIPADKGKKHALIILRQLIELKAKSKETDINEALKYFRNTQKKKSIAFVISDFYDSHDFLEGLKISNRKHDVVALRVIDSAEKTLPSLGMIQLYNAETDKKTWINSSSSLAKAKYETDVLQKEEKLLKSFTKAGIDNVSIDTEDDYILALMNLFKYRR